MNPNLTITFQNKRDGEEPIVFHQPGGLAAFVEDISQGLTHTSPVVAISGENALHYAVDHAQEGDLIAVIGKGHETYRDREGVKTPFLERELLEEYAQQIGLE